MLILITAACWAGSRRIDSESPGIIKPPSAAPVPPAVKLERRELVDSRTDEAISARAVMPRPVARPLPVPRRIPGDGAQLGGRGAGRNSTMGDLPACSAAEGSGPSTPSPGSRVSEVRPTPRETRRMLRCMPPDSSVPSSPTSLAPDVALRYSSRSRSDWAWRARGVSRNHSSVKGTAQTTEHITMGIAKLAIVCAPEAGSANQDSMPSQTEAPRVNPSD